MSYFLIMFVIFAFLFAYHKRTGTFPFSTGSKDFDLGMNIMLAVFWAVTIPTLIVIIGGLCLTYVIAMIYYAVKDKIKGATKWK